MNRTLDWGRLRDQAVVALVGLVFAGVLIWLIGHVIGIIALVAVAVVLALVLEPLLRRAQRYMPRFLAALAVYVVFLGSLAALGFIAAPPVARQSASLVAELPAYLDRADSVAGAQAGRAGIRLPPGTVSSAVNRFVLGSSTGSQSVLLQLLTVATQVAQAIAAVVLILVLAFYFMIDGHRLRLWFAGLFPVDQQPKIRFVEETVATVLGAYVRAQLIMAALMALSAGVGCWGLGVRYPALIGVLAFIAELVPLVGPFLAAIPAMVIAIFQSFGLMVEVTFFFVGMQMLENNVVRPRITGPMVGLHPVEALLALVVGAATAGFWGALFAVPAAGIAVVLLTVAIKAWQGQPIQFERHGMSVGRSGPT